MEEQNTNPAAGEEQEALQPDTTHQDTADQNVDETAFDDEAEASEEATVENNTSKPEEEIAEDENDDATNDDISDWTATEIVTQLQSLIQKTDWFKFNKRIQALLTQYEKIFQEDLETAKKDFLDTGENEINFYFKPAQKRL